eukprot:8452445-Pyramimonas_sp.AAC.1
MFLNQKDLRRGSLDPGLNRGPGRAVDCLDHQLVMCCWAGWGACIVGGICALWKLTWVPPGPSKHVLGNLGSHFNVSSRGADSRKTGRGCACTVGGRCPRRPRLRPRLLGRKTGARQVSVF